MSASGGEAANGKTKAKKKQGQRFEFINYDLNAKQQADLREMDIGFEYPCSLMMDMANEGYGVKVAPDPKRGGFRAHMTDASLGDGSVEYCLAGWGSTAEKAWASVMYRHLVVAEENWLELIGDQKGGSDFG